MRGHRTHTRSSRANRVAHPSAPQRRSPHHSPPPPRLPHHLRSLSRCHACQLATRSSSRILTAPASCQTRPKLVSRKAVSLRDSGVFNDVLRAVGEWGGSISGTWTEGSVVCDACGDSGKARANRSVPLGVRLGAAARRRSCERAALSVAAQRASWRGRHGLASSRAGA